MFFFQMALIIAALLLALRACGMLREIIRRARHRDNRPKLILFAVILAVLAVVGCQMTVAIKSPDTRPELLMSPQIDTTSPNKKEQPDEGPLLPADQPG